MTLVPVYLTIPVVYSRLSSSPCTAGAALVTQIMWNVLSDEQRQCGGVQFYFSQLTNLLVIANSSLNVVIYLTFNTRFRQVRCALVQPSIYVRLHS